MNVSIKMCIHIYDLCPCAYDPIRESRNNTAYLTLYIIIFTKLNMNIFVFHINIPYYNIAFILELYENVLS